MHVNITIESPTLLDATRLVSQYSQGLGTSLLPVTLYAFHSRRLNVHDGFIASHCLRLLLFAQSFGRVQSIGFTQWAQRTAFTRSKPVGYNSTESEPIWTKSGKVWTKCLGLAKTDFGHDPSSNDSEQTFFCEINNARFRQFPVGQVLRHFNTTTSIGVLM